MVLVAVIIGYLLGITPFVIPKVLELKNCKKEERQNEEDKITQEQILDEWLNGVNKEEILSKQVNQEDILKEYLTGIETKGE